MEKILNYTTDNLYCVSEVKNNSLSYFLIMYSVYATVSCAIYRKRHSALETNYHKSQMGIASKRSA